MKLFLHNPVRLGLLLLLSREHRQQRREHRQPSQSLPERHLSPLPLEWHQHKHKRINQPHRAHLRNSQRQEHHKMPIKVAETS
jgi:hypothetical protein